MKRKSVITLLCICMLLTAAVLGTLAYLTDRASVLNTFTVGNIDITLDETKVDENGKAVEPAERTETGNNYHLIPGQTYVKDPIVTIEPGSEESYVRMLVTFNNLSQLDAIFAPSGAKLTAIFNGYDSNVWIYAGEKEDVKNNTITYEFRYKETVENKGNSDITLDALFDSFTLPGTITKEQLETLKATNEKPAFQIDIEAHAIQAATMTDANDAWNKFVDQYPDK